jgi:hypothetical protein
MVYRSCWLDHLEGRDEVVDWLLVNRTQRSDLDDSAMISRGDLGRHRYSFFLKVSLLPDQYFVSFVDFLEPYLDVATALQMNLFADVIGGDGKFAAAAIDHDR